MSMARLVITAVTVEGRSKSEVARDYGVSRVLGAEVLLPLPAFEGRLAFEPRRGDRTAIRGRSSGAWRIRSCGCARRLIKKGRGRWRGDDRRSSAYGRGVVGAGGLDDLADLVAPRVRGRSAAETASVVVANVLRGAAERTLAGRHHPLAAGRRLRGRDLEHSRRSLSG